MYGYMVVNLGFIAPPCLRCFLGNLSSLLRCELFGPGLPAFLPSKTAKLDCGRILLWFYGLIGFRIGSSLLRYESGKLVYVSGCFGFFYHAPILA